MNLKFFNNLKNNKIKKDRYVENITREITDEYGIDVEELTIEQSKIEETLNNIDQVRDYVKGEISNKKIKYDDYFDDDIKKHLDVLHNYISRFIPNYPKYYDGDTINGKAYIDARDFIMNELPLNIDEIINSEDSLSGVVNDTKINFDNGFQMDSVGNIYDSNKDIIFKPTELHQKVSYVDLLNEKIVTENGIRIDMPEDFISKNIIENELVDSGFSDRLVEIKDTINKSKNESGNNGYEDGSSSGSSGSSDSSSGSGGSDNNNNDFSSSKIPDNIFGKVEGVYIDYKDRIFMEMPLEDTYTGDIFGDDQNIDIVTQIKKFKIESESFSVCNFNEVPYGELNSLLFWGGGERGVKPLSSSELSDKDISFKPDGTVYYSGVNSKVTIKRSGCKSKSYNTGHAMMWSTSNRVGLKRSIIQYLYSFGANIGLFNANIPKLVGFKKFKIFPGLCIGGLLEQLLCAWQERMSKRINELFQCIPSSMMNDLSQSGFENETYLYGCSVENLSSLDKISSCKYGDKYIVNVVDTSVTGLKDYACGQFVFDPNGKLAHTYPWRYKEFSGKPFNSDDVTVIKDFSTAYQNPMVQDILMNTNALGEDSITRKLLSLQHAYLKKETLLSLKDVEMSMDSTIEATIYDALDKLTTDIGRYVYMEDLHIMLESQVPGFESNKYCDEFFKHFEFLTKNGILKKPDLNSCKKTYTYLEDYGNESYGRTYIDYYDFANMNSDEYLIPSRYNISKYDTLMFSEQFSPNDQLKEVFENNLSYLTSIGQDIGKYKNIKTIRDFINSSENKDAYTIDISDSLDFIRSELEYDEYEPNAFQQVEKRCYYIIDKKVIF